MTWFCVGALVVVLLLVVYFRKAGPNGALVVSGRKGTYIDPTTGERVEKSFRVYGVANLDRALALEEATSRPGQEEPAKEEARHLRLASPSTSAPRWLDAPDVSDEVVSLVEDITADL